MSSSTNNNPLIFETPDGVYEAVSWRYVVDKLTDIISPINTSLSIINQSLTSIDNKLSEWIEAE